MRCLSVQFVVYIHRYKYPMMCYFLIDRRVCLIKLSHPDLNVLARTQLLEMNTEALDFLFG